MNYINYIEKIDRILHELNIDEKDPKSNEKIDYILDNCPFIVDWLNALAKNYYKDIKILHKIELICAREKKNIFDEKIPIHFGNEYFV